MVLDFLPYKVPARPRKKIGWIRYITFAAMQLPANTTSKTRTQHTCSLQVDRQRKQAAHEPKAAI